MSDSLHGDAEVNRQLQFDRVSQAQSEEEYLEMVMSELGDQEMSSLGADDYNYNDTRQEQKPPEPPKNYMNPTMASVLPPYLCGEVERVRNSYRTGSYNSIKKLPTNIQPGQIRQTRKQHITENLLINSNNVFKPAANRNEPFHKPEYVGTDFDKMKNMHRYLQDQEKVQTDSLSRKPFVVNSRIRAKTEDIFFDPEYQFPGMGPGTGLRKLENMVRGGDAEEDAIILEPGYVLQQKLNVGSGLQVKEWTQKIHAKLVRDWPQYQFRVKFTKSNELIVQFVKPDSAPLKQGSAEDTSPPVTGGVATASGKLNVIFPPPNNALNKYMHTMASHGLASTFGLKKRGDRWNIYEVEYETSNGSMGGTIPSYGSDINSPLHTMLRTPTASLAASPSMHTPKAGQSTKNSTAQGTPMASGLKSVRWFSKSNSINSASDGSGKDSESPSNAAQSGARAITPTNAAGIAETSGDANPTREGGPPAVPGLASTASVVSSTPRSAASATPRSVTFASGHSPNDVSPTSGEILRSSSADRSGPGIAARLGGSPPQPSGFATTADMTSKHRPPRIDTRPDLLRDDMQQSSNGPSEVRTVHYLTYAFYAPWIHTSHMNVRRAVGYHNRVKAKTYGDKYHAKYALTEEARGRLGTEDSASTMGDMSKDAHYNIYDSMKSEATSALSTPHGAASRFMNGMLRNEKFSTPS